MISLDTGMTIWNQHRLKFSRTSILNHVFSSRTLVFRIRRSRSESSSNWIQTGRVKIN